MTPRLASFRSLLSVAVLALPAGLVAENQIFFSRTFPGSAPPYFEVTVDAGGDAVYKEAPDDEFPVEFSVQRGALEELFDRAEALERFQTDIKSKRKVAFTGDKTLRFSSDGVEQGKTEFVYTENEDAQELVSWFLQVAETERHLIELERVVQFDRLGVNKALAGLEASFNRDRVVAAEQFRPILQRIVDDEKILHLARARAAALIERIGSEEQP